eukprot:gene8124-16672_t
MASRLVGAPSFHIFIHTRRVLSLYRTFLKEVKKVQDEELKLELNRLIKEEFKAGKLELDKYLVKNRLTDGQRKLEQLRSLAVPLTSSSPSKQFEVTMDDEDAAQGRVGTGWPWER